VITVRSCSRPGRCALCYDGGELDVVCECGVVLQAERAESTADARMRRFVYEVEVFLVVFTAY
jgi:hypothetical protein